MTIICSVKVRDGLVVGTDSMTQIFGADESGQIGPIKTYSNARKLFQIKSWPVSVMTYGIGNIGARSIQGLVLEYCDEIKGRQGSVETLAREIFEFFDAKYRDNFKAELQESEEEPRLVPQLGFYIAGYSPRQPFPEEWEFRLPVHKEAQRVRSTDQFGASWRGIEIPFTRLYKGYDPRLQRDLREEGLSVDRVREILAKYEAPVVYDGMPVQDAVNFVAYILNTTIGLATFEIGAPSCGGPLQIATILPTQGFEWVEEPKIRL